MGLARAAPGISLIITALISGWIFGALRRDLVIVITLMIEAVACALIPVIQNIAVYITLTFINAGSLTIVNIGCNVWAIELFAKSNAVLLQLIHFMFSMGILISSLMAPFFLAQDVPLKLLNETMMVNGTDDETLAEEYGLDFSRLRILFLIPGVVLGLVAAYFTVGALVFRTSKTRDEDQPQNSNGTCAKDTAMKPLNKIEEEDPEEDLIENGGGEMLQAKAPQLKTKYRLWAVGLSMATLSSQMGAEVISSIYMTTFLFKGGIDKESAAIMNAYGLMAFNAGRCAAIFFASKFQPKSIFLTLTLLYMASAAGLGALISSGTGLTYLITLALVCVMKAGYSANYAAILAEINSKIPIDHHMMGLLFAICGVVMASDPIIVGQFIDSFPLILPLVVIVHGTVVLVSFATLELSFKAFKARPDKYYRSNSD